MSFKNFLMRPASPVICPLVKLFEERIDSRLRAAQLRLATKEGYDITVVQLGFIPEVQEEVMTHAS